MLRESGVGVSGALRRACTALAVAALAALPTLAVAQAGGKQVVAASVKPLPLFASPGDATPAKSVAPEGLPWPILEEKQEFFRVKVGGGDYWVDSMQVRATRGVSPVTISSPSFRPSSTSSRSASSRSSRAPDQRRAAVCAWA